MKIVFVSLVLMLALAAESQATTSATGSPSAVFHSNNAPVTMRWTVTGVSGSHVSTEGIFTNPATGLAISGDEIDSPVTVGCTIGVMSIICTQASETILIPASVIAGAGALGIKTINYSRVFDDGNGPATGVVKINLLDNNLKITRESLRFSDKSIRPLIAENTKISAIAELKYTGSGILDAFWEYATPLSTAGEPIYTRLNTVRRYLGVGGRVVLQSPELPTYTTGQYLVRLQVLKSPTNPNGVEFTSDLPEGLPILRYTVVKSDSGESAYSQPPIKTAAPFDNAVLQQDTHFRWLPVAGANAYQLELYLATSKSLTDVVQDEIRVDETVLKDKKPAAGLLIPAQETSLALSALARSMLRSQQDYYWRIIAIGDDGQILTSSSLKTIRTQ